MMPFIYGDDADMVKRDLFNDGPMCIHITFSGGRVGIPVVIKYKHGGTWINYLLTMGTEVVTKMAIVRNTAKQFQREILCNQSIACEKRMYIANCLIFSRTAHNSGIWPRLNNSCSARFHSTMLSVLRSIAGYERWKHREGFTDCNAIVKVGAVMPEDWLRLARLRFLM